MQAPQSADALTKGGHVEQLVPFHKFLHVHTQLVFVLPVTLREWLLQFAAVQLRKHCGYVSYPVAH